MKNTNFKGRFVQLGFLLIFAIMIMLSSCASTDQVAQTEPASLETFSVYFIDQDCFIAYENPWEDNKDCLLMESCAASGYGIAILQSDNTFKYYYFDGDFAPSATGGQAQAEALIAATTKVDHIYIEVKGIMTEDQKTATTGETYGVIKASEMKEAPAPVN